MMYANFGEFISKKRVEKKITLRKMADMLGVSAPFLTDVEKDRRNPFDMEKLTQLAQILNLSKEENARFKNSCNVLNEMKNEIFSNEDIKM